MLQQTCLRINRDRLLKWNNLISTYDRYLPNKCITRLSTIVSVGFMLVPMQRYNSFYSHKLHSYGITNNKLPVNTSTIGLFLVICTTWLLNLRRIVAKQVTIYSTTNLITKVTKSHIIIYFGEISVNGNNAAEGIQRYNLETSIV